MRPRPRMGYLTLVSMYTCMYIYLYIYTYLCKYKCVCARMMIPSWHLSTVCIYIYAHIHVYVYIYLYIHAYTRIRVYTPEHRGIRASTLYAWIIVCLNIQMISVCLNNFMLKFTYEYINVYICTYTHTYTLHTHMHKHIYSHFSESRFLPNLLFMLCVFFHFFYRNDCLIRKDVNMCMCVRACAQVCAKHRVTSCIHTLQTCRRTRKYAPDHAHSNPISSNPIWFDPNLV